jgi:hypothetical protein
VAFQRGIELTQAMPANAASMEETRSNIEKASQKLGTPQNTRHPPRRRTLEKRHSLGSPWLDAPTNPRKYCSRLGTECVQRKLSEI